MDNIRIGIVGLGANCRRRHVPGLRACADVEIRGVVNRSRESTAAVAAEYGIPRTYGNWQQLVADPEIDVVVVGTWPYLHGPITIAALEAGKHVLTEARMAMNAAEAHQMLAASRQRPDLVAQIVPSPIGLTVDRVVQEMIAAGYLGELRELVVLAASDVLADPATPLTWRQSAEYSGINMLLMGIIHETLIRWTPDPVRVFAQVHAFTPQRTDPASNRRIPVGTPDSVQILTVLPRGARGIYHLSGAIHFGPGVQIHLYGSDGTIKFASDSAEHLWAARRGDAELQEIDIPPDKTCEWRVEADFIDAIRGGTKDLSQNLETPSPQPSPPKTGERGLEGLGIGSKIKLTDFATGVRYMEFTEAVARSAESGHPVELPLAAS